MRRIIYLMQGTTHNSSQCMIDALDVEDVSSSLYRHWQKVMPVALLVVDYQKGSGLAGKLIPHGGA